LFAGATFANFGVSKEEFLQHLKTVSKDPNSYYKPEGWKFTTY
jgi:hypothetical protein